MASEACCKRPPATADYSPIGKWDTIADLKTYVVSPAKPSRAVVLVYDVFGLAPQTLQGADRLSAALDALVLVPDFLKGAYFDPANIPPDTDEKKAAVAAYMAGPANMAHGVAHLLQVRRQAGARWAHVDDEKWAVFGLCWGGKAAVLATGAGNEGRGRRFAASGTAHPGRLAAEDAEALTVPHILLASPEEPADVVAQYQDILARPGKTGVVETYADMFHGWMGARAKLGDEKNRAEYERGYQQVADFFAKYL